MSTAVAVKLIGTPFGAPALGGLICSADGTALRPTSEKVAVALFASPAPVAYWSHSTPPALSTCSPTTVLSKVGFVSAAEPSILPHTSLGPPPYASA